MTSDLPSGLGNSTAVFADGGHAPLPATYVGANGVRLVGDRWLPHPDHHRGTVMLLHGGGQTRHSWYVTAARLASQGWTALTVDARGHGDSDWAADGDYSLAAFVSDLGMIVQDLTCPPVLVGASLGGMVALKAQADRPELARGLVLVDIAPQIDPEGRHRIEAFMGSAPNGFLSLEDVAAAVHAYNPHRPRPRDLERLRKNVRQHAGGAQEKPPAARRPLVLALGSAVPESQRRVGASKRVSLASRSSQQDRHPDAARSRLAV